MIVVDLISDNPNNKFAPYQRMANAIIDLTREKGKCEPQDLLVLGFSKQEAIDLWHMSHAMANVELHLMEDKIAPGITRGKCNVCRL